MVESVTDAVVGGSIGVAIGGWKGQLDERGGLFFFKKKNFFKTSLVVLASDLALRKSTRTGLMSELAPRVCV